MIAENQSLESFQEAIKGKKLVLFGAGFLAMKFINNCLESSKQVAYICDNNTAKHEQKLLGIDIMSPTVLQKENKNNTIVVLCTNKSNPQIVEQIGDGTIMFAAHTVMSRLFTDRATHFVMHKKEFLEIQNYFNEDYSKNLWQKLREHFIYGIPDFSDIKETTEIQYLPECLFTDSLSDKEIIVSAGVKDGKDTKKFCDFFGKRLAKLYALEPITVDYEKSKENLYEYYAKGYPINLIKCGLLDREQEIQFITDEKKLQSGRIPSEMTSTHTYKERFGNWEKENVLVRPLDSIIPSDEKVTYIKMDIEGSETKALLGAKRIIQEHKPRLAICIYHNPADYFKIPLLIKQFVPEYKFYLRHHHKKYWDTVLYATL